MPLAWIHVALRVVHSLWQGPVNQIQVRFTLFLASAAVLIARSVQAVRLLA